MISREKDVSVDMVVANNLLQGSHELQSISSIFGVGMGVIRTYYGPD